ncbi:MAG: hypothetical protein QOF98_2004, partial [Streptomyces sp.]|nr:hypothetical protein [Streptomyces sp.]
MRETHAPDRPTTRRRRLLVTLLATALIPSLGLIGLTAATGASGTPTGASAAAPMAVPAPPTGWTTMFSDDFNGAAGTGLNT